MRIRWVVAEDPWARSNGMHRRLHYQFPPGYFFLPTSSSLDLPIVKGYEWRRRHQWQEHHKRRALAASTQPKKWEPWWPYSVLFRKVEKAELSRDALSHINTARSGHIRPNGPFLCTTLPGDPYRHVSFTPTFIIPSSSHVTTLGDHRVMSIT